MTLKPWYQERLGGCGLPASNPERVIGFRGLGFGVWGFGGLGFRGLGFMGASENWGTLFWRPCNKDPTI